MGEVKCSSRNGIGDDDKAASDGADDRGRSLAFDTSVERFDINLRLFVSPKVSEGGPSPSFRFTALLCVSRPSTLSAALSEEKDSVPVNSRVVDDSVPRCGAELCLDKARAGTEAAAAFAVKRSSSLNFFHAFKRQTLVLVEAYCIPKASISVDFEYARKAQ